MCKNEQTIHYCTILSAGQWDFLLDGRSAIDRQKCLHRLMTAAVRTKTALRIKGVEIELEVGTGGSFRCGTGRVHGLQPQDHREAH